MFKVIAKQLIYAGVKLAAAAAAGALINHGWVDSDTAQTLQGAVLGLATAALAGYDNFTKIRVSKAVAKTPEVRQVVRDAAADAGKLPPY